MNEHKQDEHRGARSGCHSNMTEIRAVTFLTFSFITYNFARFTVSVVSLVSVVSVVLFRLFHFVVSGFSTCQACKHWFKD